MAVAVQKPSQTTSTLWGNISPDKTHQKPLWLMTDIMSYQYPPPPQNGVEMDPHQSNYLAAYSTSATSSMEGINESDQFGPGDKKRNKLGYHRTSVACGHCRRRKIRCIPVQNDFQNRCQNCIRLKKDCSFHSVGQEPGPSAGQRPGAMPPTETKIASASSSPAVSTGHPPSLAAHQSYPQLATMPSIQNMGPPSIKPEVYSADPKLPSSASSNRAFDYNQGVSTWIPTDTSPSMAKAPGDMNSSWRPYANDSPVSTAYSPYAQQTPSATNWPPAVVGESGSRPEDAGWTPYAAHPGRSMSYGGEPPTYPAASQGGGPPSGRSYQRKLSAPSDVYPHTIITTIPNIESIPGAPIDPHGSLSAGAIPSASYGTWQQPYPYQKSGDEYEAWYSSTGHGDNPVSASHQPETATHHMYFDNR